MNDYKQFFRTMILVPAIAGALSSQGAEAPADSTAVNTLDDLVVTGSNAAVEKRLLPYTVTVVGPRQLEAAGSSQLLSVLSTRVPSMFVTERGILGFGVSSNGGAGHIKMRGVGGDRASAVLMMVDGQPQFAGLYSHHVADFYSKDYVERVEVLRGPGSVLYGSNAMAGVVNVITRQARRDGVHGSLTAQYGSYNTSTNTAMATARYGRFSALAGVSYDHTDGNVRRFDFDSWSGYVKASWRFSDAWSLTADYTLMNFKGNDPIYPKLSNPESTDIYHQNITRGETSLSASNRYGNTDGTVRAYYSYGNHYIDDPRHFHSLDDRLGVLAYQNYSPTESTVLTLGFDFARYTGKIPMSGGTAHKPGAMGTIDRKVINEYSPYLTASQSLWQDQLVVTAGLRMANSDMFGTKWVPQFGISASPAHLFTIKASAAMGYRNPSFRELYLYRMANPDLQPEKMWNYEVSLQKSFGTILDATVTAYYSRGSNMIQAVDMKNVNTGRFINKGVEVSLACHPLETLTIHSSYSYLHSDIRNLTGAPRNQFFLGADWNAFKGFNASAELRGIGSLYVSEGIDRQNYWLLNLKASYDICRWAGVLLRLDNVTDTRYVINRGYDMPGITVTGGVSFRF